MQLPAELLENIFEHLAPVSISPYPPDVRNALSTCLFVSRGVRHLSACRLFRVLHVKSSIKPQPLDLLLSIIEPSPSLGWLSIRSFIRHFTFSIDSPNSTTSDTTTTPVGIVQAFKSDNFLPLFRALTARGDFGSQINNFEFRVSPTDIPIFTQAFDDAVLELMKLPSLQSLEIHGRFLPHDFLLGTHILSLGISEYSIDTNPTSTVDLNIEEFYTPALRDSQRRDNQLNYPELQSLKTDLTWPRHLSVGELATIFGKLTHLSIEINHSFAFSNAEAIIPMSSATLTNLCIAYHFDGYEAELPINWSINFGELPALESLEFVWKNSLTSTYQDAIARGCRPLAGLQSLLDTIHNPMPSLTTVRWNFRYAAETLSSDGLSKWLRTDPRWRRLDEILASELFPCLHLVHISFTPVAIFSNVVQEPDHEDNPRFTMASIDLGLVASVTADNREQVFPRLEASLGKNLELEAAGELIITDGGNAG